MDLKSTDCFDNLAVEEAYRTGDINSNNERVVIQLDTKVNFSLCQVLDHELRLFRELEAIKQSTKDSSCAIKALRFIDRKHKDGIDKKQLLAFLNSNLEDSHLKLSDVTSIFKRLNLR